MRHLFAINPHSRLSINEIRKLLKHFDLMYKPSTHIKEGNHLRKYESKLDKFKRLKSKLEPIIDDLSTLYSPDDTLRINYPSGGIFIWFNKHETV